MRYLRHIGSARDYSEIDQLRSSASCTKVRERTAAARVADYTTNSIPKAIARVILGGGTELQRVGLCSCEAPSASEVHRVIARPVYLRDGTTEHVLGDILDLPSQYAQL